MSNDAEPEIHNDPDLYFDDGNVIFQAGSTRFRLYRGIIAARSSVFRDMFSVPQPESQGGLVDGCVLIHLPDPAKYVRVFFSAIYDLAFFYPHPSPTTVATVTGILAMSHKYDSPVLFQRALEHLSYSFPCRFDDWAGKSEDQQSIVIPTYIANADTCPVADALLELAAVVYTTNTKWILPSLLNNLRGFPLINIVGSHHWKSDALDETLKLIINVGYSSHLASTAMVEKLMMASVPAKDCSTPSKCSSHAFRCIPTGGVLFSMKKKPDANPEYYKGICKQCKATTDTLVDSCRKGFWEGFPALCALPAWEELQKMEAAVKGTE